MAKANANRLAAADRLRIALQALGLGGLLPVDREPTDAEVERVAERLRPLNVSPAWQQASAAVEELLERTRAGG